MNATLIAKIDNLAIVMDIQLLEARLNEVVGGISKARGLIALAKANPTQAHFVPQLQAVLDTLLGDLNTVTEELRFLRAL